MSPTRKPSTVTAGLRKGLGTRPEPAAAPPAEFQLPPRPPSKVRFTLDLDQVDHQFLKEFAVRSGVGATKVMRALLDELRDDPHLAARVRARI